MRTLWKMLYGLVGRRPPGVWWRNKYGSQVKFSRGYNPNRFDKDTHADWRRVPANQQTTEGK